MVPSFKVFMDIHSAIGFVGGYVLTVSVIMGLLRKDFKEILAEESHTIISHHINMDTNKQWYSTKTHYIKTFTR